MTGDSLAMLWWEEIQDGIFNANKDDEDAYNCEWLIFPLLPAVGKVFYICGHSGHVLIHVIACLLSQ